jgi:hypothetical protein
MGGPDELLRGWLEKLWATVGPMKWPARLVVVIFVLLAPLALIVGIVAGIKALGVSAPSEPTKSWTAAPPASARGGDVTVVGGDNGAETMTLDNPEVVGGSGPNGGNVTIRGGNGGPNGPGGSIVVRGGRVVGGAATH